MHQWSNQYVKSNENHVKVT